MPSFALSNRVDCKNGTAKGLIGSLSPKEISISKEPKTLPNNLRRAEKTLADALALKVEIKSSAKGDKGKIVLNFDNEEELEKILSYFN